MELLRLLVRVIHLLSVQIIANLVEAKPCLVQLPLKLLKQEDTI